MGGGGRDSVEKRRRTRERKREEASEGKRILSRLLSPSPSLSLAPPTHSSPSQRPRFKRSMEREEHHRERRTLAIRTEGTDGRSGALGALHPSFSASDIVCLFPVSLHRCCRHRCRLGRRRARVISQAANHRGKGKELRGVWRKGRGRRRGGEEERREGQTEKEREQ